MLKFSQRFAIGRTPLTNLMTPINFDWNQLLKDIENIYKLKDIMPVIDAFHCSHYTNEASEVNIKHSPVELELSK